MHSFAQIVLLVCLFGVLIHAVRLARYVAEHDPTIGATRAMFLIFFSGMWYIGPFTYLAFRNKRPLLARACLRQMVAVTALWLLVLVLKAAGVDLFGGD